MLGTKIYKPLDTWDKSHNYAELAVWCNSNDAHIEEFDTYYESVKNEHPQPSEKELAEQEIAQCKHRLFETDYVVIKIAEGEATTEEYPEVLAERKQLRKRINELEPIAQGD